MYVVIDIFSRYAVARTASERKSEEQAKALIESAFAWQGVKKNKLTVHSDQGGNDLQMTARRGSAEA